MKANGILILIAIFAIIAIAFAIFEVIYIGSNPDIPDWVKFLIFTR